MLFSRIVYFQLVYRLELGYRISRDHLLRSLRSSCFVFSSSNSKIETSTWSFKASILNFSNSLCLGKIDKHRFGVYSVALRANDICHLILRKSQMENLVAPFNCRWLHVVESVGYRTAYMLAKWASNGSSLDRKLRTLSCELEFLIHLLSRCEIIAPSSKANLTCVSMCSYSLYEVSPARWLMISKFSYLSIYFFSRVKRKKGQNVHLLNWVWNKQIHTAPAGQKCGSRGAHSGLMMLVDALRTVWFAWVCLCSTLSVRKMNCKPWDFISRPTLYGDTLDDRGHAKFIVAKTNSFNHLINVCVPISLRELEVLGWDA